MSVHLNGFRFTPDATVEGTDAKASRLRRRRRWQASSTPAPTGCRAAANADIASGSDAVIRWNGAPIGRLVGTDDVLAPRVVLLADEQLTGVARDKVQAVSTAGSAIRSTSTQNPCATWPGRRASKVWPEASRSACWKISAPWNARRSRTIFAAWSKMPAPGCGGWVCGSASTMFSFPLC